eukprot:GEMP01008428.1.p1 GENE.GEMP01008428.1~~GEMP01008428.1.p1  ORF type:complete len:808 (+),score=263.35 GEMP01008428.1:328-2751(+)
MSKVLLEVGKSVVSTPPPSRSDAENEPYEEKERKLVICRKTSKSRHESDLCLRQALQVTKTHHLQSSRSRPVSTSGIREVWDENLLLENADLQRKLETLQRGVVESMKGNKARFMGNGSFNRKQHTTSPMNPVCSDSYITLRAAFEKKRVHLENVENAFASLRKDNEYKKQQLMNMEFALKALHARALDTSTKEESLKALRDEEMEGRRQSEKLLKEAYERLDKLEEGVKSDNEKHRREIEELQSRRECERKHSQEDLESLRGIKTTLEEQVCNSNVKNSHLQRSLQNQAAEMEDLRSRIDGQKRELEECRALLAEASAEAARPQGLQEMRITEQQAATNARLQAGFRRRIMRMWEQHQSFNLRGIVVVWRRLCVEKEERNKLVTKFEHMDEKRGDDIEKTRRECSELKSAMDRIVADHKSKEAELQAQMEALEKRLNVSATAQADKSKLLEHTQRELAEVKKQYEIANDALDKAEKLLKVKQLKAVEHENIAESADFYRKREETLLKEISEWHKSNENLQRRISTMMKEQMLCKKKIDEAEKDTHNVRKQLRTEEEIRRSLEETCHALEKKVEKLNESLKAKDEEARIANDQWQKKLVLEQERATQAEMLRRQAQDEAEELAAAKRKADDVARNLELKMKQPNSEVTRRHRAELSKLEEKHLAMVDDIRRELEIKHKQEHDELSDKATKWRQAAVEAARDMRKSVRMLVTAPKVAINVGGAEMPLNSWSFPFQIIKDAVCNEIMPRFSKCISVAEEFSDHDVKCLVQTSVEELALTLQSKVYELMPQAEGTCNWDGFGAKRGSIAS